MSERALSNKGVILSCSACKMQQQIDLGHVHDRIDADFFLCMMTGGHSGNPPPGMHYKKTQQGDGSIIGKSSCCKAQLEGELYGWAEASS
jgi:hypothetical protein